MKEFKNGDTVEVYVIPSGQWVSAVFVGEHTFDEEKFFVCGCDIDDEEVTAIWDEDYDETMYVGFDETSIRRPLESSRKIAEDIVDLASVTEWGDRNQALRVLIARAIEDERRGWVT